MLTQDEFTIDIGMIEFGDVLGGQKEQIVQRIEIATGDKTLIAEATNGNRIKITETEGSE